MHVENLHVENLHVETNVCWKSTYNKGILSALWQNGVVRTEGAGMLAISDAPDPTWLMPTAHDKQHNIDETRFITCLTSYLHPWPSYWWSRSLVLLGNVEKKKTAQVTKPNFCLLNMKFEEFMLNIKKIGMQNALSLYIRLPLLSPTARNRCSWGFVADIVSQW